jgi:hypothetical protein
MPWSVHVVFVVVKVARQVFPSSSVFPHVSIIPPWLRPRLSFGE